MLSETGLVHSTDRDTPVHIGQVAREVTLVGEGPGRRFLTEFPKQVITHDPDASAHLTIMSGRRGREAHDRASCGRYSGRHDATRHGGDSRSLDSAAFPHCQRPTDPDGQ